MSKHTPGPWAVKPNSTLGAINAGDKHIALANYFNDGTERTVDTEECLANANLIAAAPEMLELIELMRGQWIHSVHAEKCLTIIAKAKGE